jgi:hypothetical protein
MEGLGLVTERRPMEYSQWEVEDDGESDERYDPDGGGSLEAQLKKFARAARLGQEGESSDDDENAPDEARPFVRAMRKRCYLCEAAGQRSGSSFRDEIQRFVVRRGLFCVLTPTLAG